MQTPALLRAGAAVLLRAGAAVLLRAGAAVLLRAGAAVLLRAGEAVLLRAGAAVLLLALSACTRVDTAPGMGRHPWTKPNVLRVADISDPEGFNPLLSTMDLVEDPSSLVFSYLVIDDGNGKLVGDLVTDVPSLANGGISADGTTYTYHLRKGVRWHDGDALTSRDVAFTWRTVMNPKNNVFHREGYDRVAESTRPTISPSSCISRRVIRRS